MSPVQRVVVTGAAGFVGQRLCRELRTRASIAHHQAELIATDLARPEGDAAAEQWIVGDIADPALVEKLFERPLHRLFHLAGIVSGRAEADFALGKRVNLDATLALLERCRLQAEAGGPIVRFVYASSIAVFGTPLPQRIDDSTQPLPTLSYGTHKRAVELLIDDYTRRGFIDGRALRLSGVMPRPPLQNGALSAFNSDLIREPLAGRAYVCPVGSEATLWLTSLRCTMHNLMRLADVDPHELGALRALTAPALAVRVRDIVAALGRIDPAAPGRITFQPQPALEAQFGRWPLDCSSERALALGLRSEADIDALLEACVASH